MLKYQRVYEKHLYNEYPQIRWDMIRWYLEAFRFEEARAQFEDLHERYKFTSELDLSSYAYTEIQ